MRRILLALIFFSFLIDISVITMDDQTHNTPKIHTLDTRANLRFVGDLVTAFSRDMYIMLRAAAPDS